MARARDAMGGGVLPARMASSAALFQSVTTSARVKTAENTTAKAVWIENVCIFIKINQVAWIESTTWTGAALAMRDADSSRKRPATIGLPRRAGRWKAVWLGA